MDIKNLLSAGNAAKTQNQQYRNNPPTSNPPTSPTSSRSHHQSQPVLQRSVTSPRTYTRTLQPPLIQQQPQQQQQQQPQQQPPPPLPPPPQQQQSHAQPHNSLTPPLNAASPRPSYRLTQSNSIPSGDFRGALVAPQSNTPLVQASRKYSTDRFDFAENAHRIRTSISAEVLRTPPMSRHNSIAQIPTDLANSPTRPPRQLSAPSLTQAELDEISSLTKRLAENNFLYDCHRSLINILHKGFISHVFRPDSPVPQDPHSYNLLSDMKQARKAMDARIPVAEDLWVDWIHDEIMLARSTDDRIAVMELCQKAVQEEAGSSKLWRIYGDWMWYLYKSVHNISGGYETSSLDKHKHVGPILRSQSWSKDEKHVGGEVFTWNAMLDVWIQGVKATEWHMNDSHMVWDPYVDILLHDLSRHPSPDKVKHVWTFYAERLQKPHATWQETFQGFSQFVTSHYDNSIYEDTMVAANQQSAKSKQEYELRQDFEIKLQAAADNHDQNIEWTVMSEYLEWELGQFRRRNASPYNFDLYIALLERANLRFPTATEWWEDHVDAITDNPDTRHDVLPLLHRATRHCPWSGNLWSKHLVALEVEARPFEELEDVKHRATTTGLLEEIGGMDELIKVYTAWCGFLRRRAFRADAGEDECDVAEMGIRSVIENVKDIGARKYGKDFKGDPLFRAERIYLKFLPQMNRYADARDTWNRLKATHGDLYDFWDRYYLWEMIVWGKDTNLNGAPPTRATSVLQQAIRRPNLDYPEKMLELYIHHCGQHETTSRLQEALSEARRISKQVIKRREKEASDAAKAQSAPQEQFTGAIEHEQSTPQMDEANPQAKRKREDEANQESAAKRARSEDSGEHAQATFPDASSSTTLQIKRDRENTTIVVRHLSVDTSEKRIRQFFRDCGAILSLNLVVDEQDDSQTATIEFESKEDVLAAQTKNMKSLDGQSIDIQIGTGTTLWVTNYPPEADENYLRDIFKDRGEIVEIRFPSLKYNTHRRFCYIQFLTPAQAQSAAQLDGKSLPGNFKLTAKISDPSARKDREGAMHEGREVFVGNLAQDVTELDLRNLFEKFGTIQSVRIPRNMAGKSKCIGFIVFSTKEEAESACELNLKEVHDRLLKVSMSRPNAAGSKRSATSIIHSGSREDSASDASPTSTPTVRSSGGNSKDYRERTVLLRNVPDTINDARIRTLMEIYGPLRKVTLKPHKNEAMVEYEDLASVGKAELGVQGQELAPGMPIEIGRLENQDQDQTKNSNYGRAIHGNKGLTSARVKSNGFVNTFASSQPMKRPGQLGGAKRGGRGGLGFRSGTTSTQATAASENATAVTNGVKTTTPGVEESNEGSGNASAKSNDDFRELLAAGK